MAAELQALQKSPGRLPFLANKLHVLNEDVHKFEALIKSLTDHSVGLKEKINHSKAQLQALDDKQEEMTAKKSQLEVQRGRHIVFAH